MAKQLPSNTTETARFRGFIAKTLICLCSKTRKAHTKLTKVLLLMVIP